MNAYRDVVPRAQFTVLKNETAKLRDEIPTLRENIDSVKMQMRNIENEINFMTSNAEDVDKVKAHYDAKVKAFEKDIELVKKKINECVGLYSFEKMQGQNIDLAFKRIINTLIKYQNKEPLLDEHLQQFMKELTLTE